MRDAPGLGTQARKFATTIANRILSVNKHFTPRSGPCFLFSRSVGNSRAGCRYGQGCPGSCARERGHRRPHPVRQRWDGAGDHVKPDDMKSVPAGNAGDRIACGVILRAPDNLSQLTAWPGSGRHVAHSAGRHRLLETPRRTIGAGVIRVTHRAILALAAELLPNNGRIIYSPFSTKPAGVSSDEQRRRGAGRHC
jgi:hypothetical protein